VKTVEERKKLLDKEIFKHVNHGWRVLDRSDTACLLVRDKKAKGCLFIFLLLLFIIPGIIYLYVKKGKSYLKVEVTKEGNVKYFTDGLSSSEIDELRWY
jgi:hypothetical protein